MRLRYYWNKKSPQFTVRAIGDKLFTKDGIRYLLFFEADQKIGDEKALYKTYFPFRIFFTPNGFHSIGFGVHSAEEKKIWLMQWKRLYPDSDYNFDMRGSWSFLKPHSLAELRFIAEQSLSANLLDEPRLSDYYRDKRVFENWERENGNK